jgi:hypothetical protein
VKWQDLGYEFATWEDPKRIQPGVIDFDKFVDDYWKRRTEKLKPASDQEHREKPKKSLVSLW